MAPVILTIIIFIMTSRLCTAGDTLLPGQTLLGNQTLVSKDGIYELGFFENYYAGHHVYFLGIWMINSSVLWVANRDNPLEDPLLSELHITSTGNLVLTQSEALVWSTDLTSSDETTSTIAVLLDTGNLVLKEEGNISIIVWQSFDHPTDTWFPGAPLGFNVATGKNVYLTYLDDSGSITFSLELDPSRGRGFIIRQLSSNATYYGIFPQVIDIEDYGNGLVTFKVSNKNHAFLQLVGMNYWVNDPPNISTIWFGPNTMCDFDSFCGPSSLCSAFVYGAQRQVGNIYSDDCACPDYFHPAYPEEWWGNGYYRGGCSRDISLNCQISRSSNFDDVFLKINNISKYPDNPQLLVLKNETECAAACLSNCSCAAYSYHTSCSQWFGELQNAVLTSNGINMDEINIRVHIPAPKHSRKAGQIIIMSAIGVAALLVVGLLFFFKHKTITRFILNQKDVTGDQLVAYSYAETKRITRNFFNKLGEGGFGTVFKGSLPSSTVVAVKRMKTACYEEKQFRTEVQTIGIIQHINLVKLVGFCSEGTKRLLVYEYMPNGSLDSHLFPNQCDGLNWNTRYKIMVGIARGLTYLHEECQYCIIHCDIKPENILLDANFYPKIADFGMAKLLGRNFSRALTAMRGTIGYLGPEWISGQPITKKADVYSFGMVLFEIISGKRNTEKFQNTECSYFPLYAAMKTKQGEIGCLLDNRLQGNADLGELNIACKVACWCIQELEMDRPSMQQVVQMLEGVVEVLMPPIPSFLQRLVDLENDSMYSVIC